MALIGLCCAPSPVRPQHGARSDLLLAPAGAAFLLGLLLDVLVPPLLFLAGAAQLLLLGHLNPLPCRDQRLLRIALIRSHLPIFERPGVFLSLAISYSCWRLRSSSAWPASPPR